MINKSPTVMLNKYLDTKNKLVNINKVKDLKYEELCKLYKSIYSEECTYKTKSEISNKIINHYLGLSYKCIGIGIVEIKQSNHYNHHGFVKSFSNCLSCSQDDCFISPDIISKFMIRNGDCINYSIVKSNNANKRLSVGDINCINNIPVSNIIKPRPMYEDMKIIYPNKLICLHYDNSKYNSSSNVLLRVINTFAPIGFGQRSLIVAPPKSGKTTIIQTFAKSISTYYASDLKIKVLILLIGERPEEISEIEDMLGKTCEIFHSDFHDASTRHINVSEICISRAKRLAEIGINVILFIDSITRIARAYNETTVGSGKTMSGGLEYSALQKTKKIFGAAGNNTSNSSITIIGTCLVGTGSKLDETVHEEFKGTGNCDIVLSRQLSNRNIFPAIDIMQSGTRRSSLMETYKKEENVKIIRKICTQQHSNNRYYEYMDHIINIYNNSKNEDEFFDRTIYIGNAKNKKH